MINTAYSLLISGKKMINTAYPLLILTYTPHYKLT